MVTNMKPISSRCATLKLVARRRSVEVKGNIKWIPIGVHQRGDKHEYLMMPIPVRFDSEGRRILSASSGKRYCGVPMVGYKDPRTGKIISVMPSNADIKNMSTKQREANNI